MAKRKRRPPQNRPKFNPFKSVFSQAADEDENLSPMEKRLQEFEAADYEEQLSLCDRTIEEATLMDGELAFEMFNTLYYKTVEHDERPRFEALANKLRQRLPEVFAQEAQYIVDWQITNALAEERIDDILPLARAIAPAAAQHLDAVTLTLDQLDYHGQLAAVLEITSLAWPDRGTLDRFLASALHFLGGARYHETVATLELIPAWLRFLQSRQLIDDAQYNKTLQELRGLDTQFLNVLKGYSDPALARAMEQWREKNAI